MARRHLGLTASRGRGDPLVALSAASGPTRDTGRPPGRHLARCEQQVRQAPRETGAPNASNRPDDGPAPMLLNRSRPGTADPAPRPAPAGHEPSSGRHDIGPAGATATSRPRPCDLHGSLEASRKPHNAGRPLPRPLDTRSSDRVSNRHENSPKCTVRPSDHAPSSSRPRRRQ